MKGNISPNSSPVEGRAGPRASSSIKTSAQRQLIWPHSGNVDVLWTKSNGGFIINVPTNMRLFIHIFSSTSSLRRQCNKADNSNGTQHAARMLSEVFLLFVRAHSEEGCHAACSKPMDGLTCPRISAAHTSIHQSRELSICFFFSSARY